MVSHNRILGNGTASNNFGGVYRCNATIENNLILLNCAYTGGGIHNSSGTIVNNTIFGNRAVGVEVEPVFLPTGGGIASCTGTIRNNILWGNTVLGEPSQIVDSSTPEYCGIEGWQGGGVGNLFTDPRFVDPENGDFRLSPFSYLIDSGATVPGLATDLDGNPRPATSTLESRGDGSHMDIGAYEFQGVVPANAPPRKPTNIAPAAGAVGVSIGPVLESSNFYDSDVGDLHIASQWQADAESAFQSPEYDSGTDIDHLIKVRAYGGSLAPDTRYFWRVRHLDSRLSWSEWSEPTRMWLQEFDALFVPNDFPTVQEAVNAVSPGGVIVVRGGRYFENVVLPGIDFHLRSVDPSDWEVVEGTMLDGTGKFSSILTFQGTEGPQFVLEGLTFTNGFGLDGGAILGNNSTPTIRENYFLRNLGFSVGGGIYQCNGLIAENKFLFNVGRFGGGGLNECNGEIRNNLFARNYGGAIDECDGLIHSNIVTLNESGIGGGFHDCNGTIYNNLVFNNRAKLAGNAFAGCSGKIINNTLCNNYFGIGHGFYQCRGTIRNNIVYESDPLRESSTPTYCLLVGNWAGGGEGNIRANPRFVDPENGDFRLRSDSPCIDAGGSLWDFLPHNAQITVDYDGKDRPLQGVNVSRGDGSLYDMGAYEFHLFDNYLSDIDGDLKVNYLDLFEFEPGWHQETDFAEDHRNLNGDFAIDALDLLVLMNDWGVETGAE